jgi:hypothetical protein
LGLAIVDVEEKAPRSGVLDLRQGGFIMESLDRKMLVEKEELRSFSQQL